MRKEKKEKKPDEPKLFAPVPLLKIKSLASTPSSTCTSLTPSKPFDPSPVEVKEINSDVKAVIVEAKVDEEEEEYEEEAKGDKDEE